MLVLLSSVHRYGSWWNKDTQGWKLIFTHYLFTVGDPHTHRPANLHSLSMYSLSSHKQSKILSYFISPFIKVSVPTLTRWRAVSQRPDMFLIFHSCPLDSLLRLYCDKINIDHITLQPPFIWRVIAILWWSLPYINMNWP